MDEEEDEREDNNNNTMNIVPWKEADDDVLGPCRREENAEASGKTAISKPLPPLPSSSSQCSSSSSSWLRSKDPRIVRVSRAFGGKDRHSKVCTIRGLRDRRVRLSVPTAIQLYDLQERLGVDQPSKVVDWLLDAAKEEIDELPPLPISPESFSLLHHHHHQAFLNLKPGLGPGSGSSQLGFKIGGDSARVVSRTELCNDENEDDEENGKREEHGTVLTNTTDDLLPRMMHQQRNQHHQHVGFDGSCYNMDIHHSGFQTDHHHNHNLVPFPSQILVCPTTAMTTTATIQPLFPSPAAIEVIDPRQMINPFQVPGSSQNAPSLYSLMHANNSGSHINIRMPVQFNTANISTTATAISRVLGSESSTSGGSDRRN